MKESSEKNSEKSSEKTEDKILALLKENNEMTIAEIAKKLKLSTRAIENQMNKLKVQKHLKRVGSDRKGIWKIS